MTTPSTPPPTKPPPIAEALRGSLAYAARAREHLRAGLSDARLASLTPPRADEHARRFFFGFALPLTMMRVAWSNPHTKASIRRRLLPPLLFVGLVATIGVFDIVRTVAETRHDPTTLTLQIEDDDDDTDEPRKHDAHHGKKDDAAEKASEEAIVKAAKDVKDKGGSLLDISAAAIEAARAQGEAAAAQASAQAVPATAAPAPASGRVSALRAVWAFLTSKIAKLIATLSAIEWILVWIGREHHDQIAFEIAQLTGVPGEALAAPPRLRFDLAWLKLKGWRALRLLFFFALALPMAWLVGMIPRVGDSLALAAEGAWAAYWACVFAIGNTQLAWEDPPSDYAPWFVRALHGAGRVPLLGIPFRIYGRIVARVTRNVWPACLAFERTTWESAGLALARTIASAPVVYLITRTAFTPAATHALLARSAPADPPGDLA